jgi:hypothetical protein
VLSADRGIEEAVTALIIVNGHEGCRVTFLPRSCFAIRERFISKFAQVVEMYASSENSHKRRKDARNYGMASCTLLDAIPLLE